MAWVTPVAPTYGQLITVAKYTQDAVDNPQYLFDNLGILDAGKIAYSLLGAAGTFDISNIPQDYDDLLLVAVLRGSTAAAQTNAFLRFNNDSGAASYLWVDGYIPTSIGGVSLHTDVADSEIQFQIMGDSATAGYVSALFLHIQGYSKTTFNKLVHGTLFGSQSNLNAIAMCGGMFLSTAAIDRIQLSDAGGNFIAGCSLAVYAGQHL